MKTNNVEDMAL